jgi:parallel beta-helix repeat protein
MGTKTLLRSVVAASIAATLAACGDQAKDIDDVLQEQAQNEQQQAPNYSNSGGNDPIPAVTPAPSVTEQLTIEVPGGKDANGNYLAYPFNVDGEVKFYFGLDEHEVDVPAESASVIHLTFTGDYDPQSGDLGPAVELQDKLADLSGDITVVLPEGTFAMNQELRLDLSLEQFAGITSLTIMGHGIDKTILSYTGSDEGVADSVSIKNATDLEVAHFSVIDSNKNAIIVEESNGVYMHHLGTIWPGTPEAGNGAYGLYPVESQNVIVEDSFAFGSADAGIYVGQTDDIVVRRNFAVQNVAGIEIENSKRADVYDNYAYMNTGGILIFDLPIGNGRYGLGTRVFRNVSVSNNQENFAAGGVVHMVPPGTGVLLLASDTVEVFDNDISGNDTFAVVGVSYFLVDSDITQYTGNPVTMTPGRYSNIIADGWRPTLRSINVHSNRITNTGGNPRGDLLEAPLTDGAPGILEAFMGLRGYLPAFLTDGMGQNLANNGIINSIGEPVYDETDYLCVDPDQQVSTGTVIEHTGAVSVIDLATFSLNLAAATFEVDNTGGYLFNCDTALERLPAYSATFRGETIGCGEDDNGEICMSAMPPEAE